MAAVTATSPGLGPGPEQLHRVSSSGIRCGGEGGGSISWQGRHQEGISGLVGAGKGTEGSTSGRGARARGLGSSLSGEGDAFKMTL